MKKHLRLTRLKVTASIFLIVLLATVGFAGSAAAAETRQTRWSQQEAVRMVKEVLSQEETNDFAWDKINWLVEPAEAAVAAEKENKPILVYFFLKGTTGPAAAPC